MADQDDLMRSAARAMRLKDIVLSDAVFSQPDIAKINREQVEATQQFKRAVEFAVSHEEGQSTTQFFVKVDFGTRLIADLGDGDETILCVVEAGFLVCYEFDGEIDPEVLKAFAEVNAVHNAWPFWRQHVFDIKQRSQISELEIPLMVITPGGLVTSQD